MSTHTIDFRRSALTLDHGHEVIKRGIAAEVADARGYHSVKSDLILRRKGFTPSGPGILIPIFNLKGKQVTHQYRPDKPSGSGKYLSPARRRLYFDVPPTVRENVLDPTQPLVCTEGIFKGDAVATAGYACITFVGVDCWQTKGEPLPEWDQIPLEGRDVYIGYDSDSDTNSDVERALDRLREFLESKGAHVYVLHLKSKGGNKVGLDDFLADGGDLEELMAEARSNQAPVEGISGDVRITRLETPEFPIDVLPRPARAYVERLAEGGLPLEFLGPAALSVMTTATGGMVDVEVVAGSWIEPLILWHALVGVTGSGKSPSIDNLRRPLDAVQRMWRGEFEVNRQAWVDLDKEDRKGTQEPQQRRLVFGDFTLEALVRMLAVKLNHAGLVVIADELAALIDGLGQYKGRGADRPALLSLWSGTPLSYDRVGDNIHIWLERPIVNILGGVQPRLLSALLGDDGLRERFCFSQYDKLPPEDLPVIKTASYEEKAFAQLIGKLVQRRDTWRTRTLTADTQAFFEAERKRFRGIQIAIDTPPHVQGWMAKAPSQLIRHALLLSEVGHLDQPVSKSGIDLVYAQHAAKLVDYFAAHFAALPFREVNLMVSPQERGKDEAVDRLADYVRRRPDKHIYSRDVLRLGIAGCKTADDVAKLIVRYEKTHTGHTRTVRRGGWSTKAIWAPGYAPGEEP